MKEKNQDIICIWIFPVLSLLLTVGIIWSNPQSFCEGSAGRLYMQNAIQGKIGYGCAGYYGNPINFSGLEPGDLILGSYPDCAYGEYSHAGLYLGNGKVLEGFVDLGVNIQDIEHYRQYQKICLLHIKADKKIKNQAVESAQKYEGALFYPLAFKPGDRIFNCTKIMWLAYMQQGIDLAPDAKLWISPDDFKRSPYASVIGEGEI
ncbi:NlpC/P60 family protein [Syntrophomonas palmitatica]|uniref:NlpC/P60 family protein n=1 Tax=Syntrophomonas palmitatica TaxID=402877 RepID=UPI0012EE33D1|nr:NlpC/P60 family protein [Syntrophomonas palmitatica]